MKPFLYPPTWSFIYLSLSYPSLSSSSISFCLHLPIPSLFQLGTKEYYEDNRMNNKALFYLVSVHGHFSKAEHSSASSSCTLLIGLKANNIIVLISYCVTICNIISFSLFTSLSVCLTSIISKTFVHSYLKLSVAYFCFSSLASGGYEYILNLQHCYYRQYFLWTSKVS